MLYSRSRARHRLARRLSWLVVASLTTVALLAPAASVQAAAPDPSYEFGTPGIAVDGDRSDWTSADFFADMYRAGDADKKVESKLFLRYNCDNDTLYVMVETVDGVALADGDDFVKIDGEKKVGSATGGNPAVGNYTQSADNLGWEASFGLAEGTYDLDVHAQVSDGGSQTSALAGRSAELTIDCPEASAPPSSAPPSSAPPSSAPPSSAPPSSAPPSEAPELASILIAKLDNRGTADPEDDVLLDGASFEIYLDDGDEAFDDGDERVFGAAAARDGLLDTDRLEAGWYWIVEAVVPDGFVGSDPILVELNTDASVTCIWDVQGPIECERNTGNVNDLSWTIVLVDNSPVEETPAPTGGVGGATGTPGAPGITLPPTDTFSGGIDGPTGEGWRLMLLAMASLMAAALLVTPAAVVVRRDDKRR